MKIISHERAETRAHNAAGKDWAFALDDTGTLACDVDDDAALAVFLHPRNANLFRADEPPAPLTRPAAAPPEAAKPVKGKGKAAAPPEAESAAAASAKLILDNDEATVLNLIEQIKDAAVLAELNKQEQGRALARINVLAAIAKRG